MRRVIELLERWLPLLACLSGAVVPVSQWNGDGAASDADTAPPLDAQLHEILDFIVLQEQMWRPERRIKDPSANQSRKPRRP
jgi:hypothetical protein